jgi:aryl carrier-like protein
VVVDSIPLTANGKVDRAALALAAESAEGAPITGIVDGAEAGSVSSEESDAALVRGLWAAVLGMSGLSGAANFFSAGGDSLSAMQAIVRLRAAGIPADVTRLYEAPTLAEFIQLVAAPLN